MAQNRTLDDLWALVPATKCRFEPHALDALPAAARLYLSHSIAPGSILASAVRLHMHGEIKLGRWLPFKADQVIRLDRGMIWNATIRMNGLPVEGFDQFLDGEGTMKWKLLGIVPMTTASGPDISRSAAGRLQAELVWLPTAFCKTDVLWTEQAPLSTLAAFTILGHSAKLDLTLGDAGRLRSIGLRRWGNPTGGEFGEEPFGALIEEEGMFDGFTIPTQLRVGWHFGTRRFANQGEFFRVRVDHAMYR